ncbi:MAG: glycosyltransferase family 4 protein [Flavipsychrobacter sp.]
MSTSKCNILCIAPYNIIPVKSGGQAAIVSLHHALGGLCTDHIAGATSNTEHNYSFTTHPIYASSPTKYIPYYKAGQLTKLAKENNITHIICEHPYMAINAMHVAKRMGIPWYIRSHNIESERFRALGKPWWWLLRHYEQYAMKRSNGIFFITQEDATWAIDNFKIAQDKCHTIPFGTNIKSLPKQNLLAKATLGKQLNIDPNSPWLYFLGALDYTPNSEAVGYIINEVLPLIEEKGYQILIGGKGLPEALQQLISKNNNIHYLGFVDDLDMFLHACDIMLNPVLKGGGIKTKAVEALAYNNTVISTESGAAGISQQACGDKLSITKDYYWAAFADAINTAVTQNISTPESFYETYYNGNIAKKVLGIINSTSR